VSEPFDSGLLKALRDVRATPAPAASRARVAGRLAALFPGMPLAAAPSSSQSPPSPSPSPSPNLMTSVGLSGTRALAGLCFILGGAAGAAIHASVTSLPAPSVVYVEVPVLASPTTAASLPAPASTLSPVLPPALPMLSPSPAPALSSAPTLTPSPAPAVPLAQLDAERVLLDEARGALAHGDGTKAVDALERHERSYPRPILGEEREAILVEALVGAGRSDEARARADTFRRKYPHSLFATAVDAAIASIP
jgi:hypothetical protein